MHTLNNRYNVAGLSATAPNVVKSLKCRVKKYRVFARCRPFLPRLFYLCTTKVVIIFIYTNILHKKFIFFCVFLLGRGFTYIYIYLYMCGGWRSSGVWMSVQLVTWWPSFLGVTSPDGGTLEAGQGRTLGGVDMCAARHLVAVGLGV